MVLAKDPQKVKLENFHNSRVPKLGNYTYLGLRVLWGFYSSVELTFFFPGEKELFLIRKILIKVRIL